VVSDADVARNISDVPTGLGEDPIDAFCPVILLDQLWRNPGCLGELLQEPPMLYVGPRPPAPVENFSSRSSLTILIAESGRFRDMSCLGVYGSIVLIFFLLPADSVARCPAEIRFRQRPFSAHPLYTQCTPRVDGGCASGVTSEPETRSPTRADEQRSSDRPEPPRATR